MGEGWNCVMVASLYGRGVELCDGGFIVWERGGIVICQEDLCSPESQVLPAVHNLISPSFNFGSRQFSPSDNTAHHVFSLAVSLCFQNLFEKIHAHK